MDTRQEDILLYNDRHKDNPLMLYELCVFKKDDAEDILLNRAYKEDGEHLSDDLMADALVNPEFPDAAMVNECMDLDDGTAFLCLTDDNTRLLHYNAHGEFIHDHNGNNPPHDYRRHSLQIWRPVWRRYGKGDILFAVPRKPHPSYQWFAFVLREPMRVSNKAVSEFGFFDEYRVHAHCVALIAKRIKGYYAYFPIEEHRGPFDNMRNNETIRPGWFISGGQYGCSDMYPENPDRGVFGHITIYPEITTITTGSETMLQETKAVLNRLFTSPGGNGIIYSPPSFLDTGTDATRSGAWVRAYDDTNTGKRGFYNVRLKDKTQVIINEELI